MSSRFNRSTEPDFHSSNYPQSNQDDSQLNDILYPDSPDRLVMSKSANNLVSRRNERSETSNANQMSHKFTFTRALQEKEIAKLVSKLPYKIREGVNSVVNMTLSQTENIYKDLEVSKMEASSLRSELTKKIDEIHTLRKTCDLYQEKSRYLEENVATLKDNIDSKQKFTLKNRSAISKLATTNRLLIDSLDALQAKSTLAVKQPNHRNFNSSFDFAVNTNEISGPNTQANTAHNSIIPHNNFNMHSGGPKQRSGLLLPISNPNLTLPSNLPILTNIKDTKNQFVNNLAQNEYEKTEKQFSMFQNDKLRESLLRVSREHYKAIKNGEILEAKVSELRTSLKNQEQLNRKLKGEIAELKIVHHTELSSVDDAANKTTATQDNTSFNANKIVHKFNAIDQKFKALVERNGFDPLDGIQQLRRIMAHMAQSPQNFNLQDSVRHIVSKETIKIFDSHMISLFLLEHPNTFLGGRSGSSAAVLQQVDKHAEKAQLYTNNKILKYNVRSNKPECIELNSDIKSLVLEVMYSGKLLRLNTLHHNNNYYHLTLDACHGIVTKRMLYLPLYNKNNDSIIGCLQLVNKGQNNEAFSDLDEIFGLVFADAVSLLLTNCFLYDKICKRSLLFKSILECNSALYSIIPDKYINKTLTIGDIIAQMESVVKDLLKCNKTRVFLCADAVGNSSNNNSNNGNSNNSSSNNNIRASIISIRSSTGDNSNAIAVATTTTNGNNNNNNNNSNSSGFMIQLEHDQMASMSASSSSENKSNATVMVPSTSGIAGHVIQTKSIYTLVESSGFDPYMNPTIDLDNTADFAMVTVPIISNNNVVLGCIECQLGQLSPSLTNTNEANEDANKSGKYDFIQAAVSAVSQLLHSIEYLLANVNKNDIIVPQYTPKLLIKHSNLQNSSNNSNNISHTGSQNVTPRDTNPSGSGTGTGTHSGMKKNPRTNTNRNVLFITETYESQENGHEQEIYEYKQTIHELEHTNNTQTSTIKELKLQLEIKESQTEQNKLKITDLENHISTLNKQSNSRGATPKDASNSSKNNTNSAQNKEDKQKISILEHQLATLQSEIALIRHNKNVEQNNKNTAHVTQINTLTTENNNLANENKQLQTELQSTKIALSNSTDNTKNVTDRLNNTITLLNKELLNKIEHFAVEKNKIQSESEQWRSELNNCNSLLIIQKKHIAELEAKIAAINNNNDNNSNNNSSNKANNNSANINSNNSTRNNNNNSSNKSHNSSSKSLLQNTLKKQNTSDTSDYSSSSLFYSVSVKDTSIMDGNNELDNSLINVDSNNNSWRADDRRSSVDSVLFPALVADEVQTIDELSKQNTNNGVNNNSNNNNSNSNSANQQSENLNETVLTTPAASTKTPSQFINALKNKANVNNTSNSNIGNSNSANNSIKNNLQHNISNSSNNSSVKQPPSTTVSQRDMLPVPDPVESVVESVGKLSVSQSASRNASQKSMQIDHNNNSSSNISSNDLSTTAAVQHTVFDNNTAITDTATATDADVANVSIDPETNTTNTEYDTNNTDTALNTDTAYNNTTAAVDSDNLQQETDTLPAGENNWQELQDSEGNTYYYNSGTGECSWVKPDENGYIAPSDIIGAELPAVDDTTGLLQGTDLESSQVVDDFPNEINDWIRNFDEHGTEYWVHQISGESQWERPSLDDEPGGGSGLGAMYDTNMSHYSATAGDYTIEL